MRGLSEQCVSAFAALSTDNDRAWFRDALLDPRVHIAIREDSINVYYRGASLFLMEYRNGAIRTATHFKYLIRQNQSYITLGPSDPMFQFDKTDVLWTRYSGKTLDEMCRAAARLAGPEKIGVHNLVKKSSHVIDVEITLQGGFSIASAPVVHTEEPDLDEHAEIREAIEEADAESMTPADGNPGTEPPRSKASDKIDIATLESIGNGIRLVFHEAKHFVNAGLRNGATLEQVERYESALQKNMQFHSDQYRSVCKALLAINGMRKNAYKLRGGKQPQALDDLIHQVAEGESFLVDTKPRLIIFGFDQDQKNGRVWRSHRNNLVNSLGEKRLYEVGNTKGARIPTARA